MLDPSEAPIWMIGPSRPTAGAAADGQRRGERFHHRNDGPDAAFLVEDRVHDLGHAVAARFRRKFLHQENHAHAADHRHQDDEAPQGDAGV